MSSIYCCCKITVDSDNWEDRMKSIMQYYRVDRRKICFLKFIFEAYEGVVSITTVDAGLGIVSLSIPPGCEADVADILTELQKDIRMAPCPVEADDKK